MSKEAFMITCHCNYSKLMVTWLDGEVIVTSSQRKSLQTKVVLKLRHPLVKGFNYDKITQRVQCMVIEGYFSPIPPLHP